MKTIKALSIGLAILVGISLVSSLIIWSEKNLDPPCLAAYSWLTGFLMGALLLTAGRRA